MSLSVMFLKFKVEVGTMNLEVYPYSDPYLVSRLHTLADTIVLPVNTRVPGASYPDNVNITGDYNRLTNTLQAPGFASSLQVINTHYLRGSYDLERYHSLLKMYAPGARVLTTDLEVEGGQYYPGTLERYCVILTELSTGDYGLYPTGTPNCWWYNSSGALIHSITNFSPFVNSVLGDVEGPNVNNAVVCVSGINDDMTIPDDSSVSDRGADVRPGFHPVRVYSRTDGAGDLSGAMVELINRWQHYLLPPGGPDPYEQIPNSGTGGGGGTYDPSSSDDIDFPGIPGVSAVNTGFISLWSPTEQQMLNLSRYMWNVDITTIDFWKRLWADPMDIIYGLNIIPVDFRATGRTIIGGTEHVIVGLVNTKVDMDYLVSQWIDVDCGSIDIDEMWGAYLDYDPYTKLEIYLPYCGYHPLRIDDFMSGSISLKYRIDLLSGACIAIIKATKPNDDLNDLDSVIYQFMGNCATQIPVTATQFADAVRSTMSLAASIGTMVATGVGGAAAAASKQGLSTVGKAQLASSMIGEGAAAVENVMGIKPAIERSGALGGAAGLLAVQTPYLVLTRPRQAHPEAQNVYTGYPSFMTRELSQCSGWTIVKEIHLDNIPCTSEEMIEIDNLLKEGVIL